MPEQPMSRRMTDEQLRAVKSLGGDLAIRAGAGSGKTTVLAHRFAEALLADLCEGEEPSVSDVLTITFTSKAAAEIAERVRRVLAEQVSPEVSRNVGRAWISTIHGFCARILRRHRLEAGVDPYFATADEVTTAALKVEAFEHAATALYGSHSGVTTALGVFASDTLRDHVVACFDKARAMGLDPHDARVQMDNEALDALHAQVRLRAEELARALSEAKPVASLPARVAELEAWRTGLETCRFDSAETCRAAVETADSFGFGRLFDDVAKERLAELKVELEKLAKGARALAEQDLLEGIEALIVRFAQEYERLKRERGLLDFDDLQERTVRLLETDSGIAETYRKHFRHLMVDEFQDTNDLQVRVLRPIRNDNLCVVGDERQSIYGFRYADVEIFERISAEMGEPIRLADNFRSHSGVLHFTNEIFSQPHLFGSSFMKLRAGREDGWLLDLPEETPRVECLFVDGPKAADKVRAEALLLAKRAAELVAGGLDPQHIAILLRAGGCAGVYAEALEAAGVPVAVNVGAGLYEAIEVQEVMQLLRAIAVPNDDQALLGVLSGRLVGLSDDGLVAVTLAAHGRPLWAGLTDLAAETVTFGWLADEEAAALDRASCVLDELNRRQASMSLGELCMTACEAFDYDVTLHTLGPAGIRAWANVRKVARYADAFEQAESNDAAAFVGYLGQRMEVAADKAAPAASEHAVRVMTIHAAKGLEFPVVFVAGLNSAKQHTPSSVLVTRGEREGRAVPVVGVRLPKEPYGCAETPLWQTLAEDASARGIEEEKRCLYVACTRAKELLVLSGGCALDKPAEEGPGLIDWVREALPGEGDRTLLSGGVPVLVREEVAEAAQDTGARAADGAELSDLGELVGERPVFEGAEDGSAVPLTVSFSGLKLHERCPLAYHARYRLGLRTFAAVRGSSATDFGSAFHAAMQAPDELTEGRMHALAASFGLDDGRVEQLRRAVSLFADSSTSRRVAAAQRVFREQPFSLNLGDSRLEGATDLIAWQGESALIVDYKTGAAPSAEHDGRDSAYELQAQCYALAALAAGAQDVEVCFEFVEHAGHNRVFEFTQADAPELETGIRQRIAAVGETSLESLCEYNADLCPQCPAAGAICDVGIALGKAGPRKRV